MVEDALLQTTRVVSGTWVGMGMEAYAARSQRGKGTLQRPGYHDDE